MAAASAAGLGMMNQLCKVCGEPAAGYHFGAFTCEGCKSFFGRTYNNLTTLGDCKNSGQCVINKKNRTSCKSCRLKKCLMVGMSKSGSRYGRRSNWFKIHCLIQDQTEMSSRLSEQTNGGDKDGQYRESTSSSSPDTLELYRGGTPDASPPYDRKESVSFHPLPLSPVSPLHHSKFYFHHPTALWTKSLNGLSRKFNMDLGYALPMRVSHNGDFLGDLPEQDIPIDLSVRKAQLGGAENCTLADEPMSASPAEQELAVVDEKPRVETPLDLTKKELQVD